MNTEDRSSWWIGLGAVAAVAVAARAYVWPTFAGAAPIGEAQTLEMLAWNVRDGLGFRDVVAYWPQDALSMPFFPLLLSGLYALAGDARLLVQLVLAALSVATCLAVAGVGRVAFGSRTVGVTAGAFAAIYPPFIASSAALAPETVLTFLLAFGTLLLFRAALERGRGAALASGLTFGLAALTSLLALAALPAILAGAVAAFLASGRTRRLVGPILVPWALALLLTLSIWPARNMIVLGEFFPGSSEGFRALWVTTMSGAGAGARETLRREAAWRDPAASEIERNRRLENEVRERAAADPGAFVTAAALRTLHLLAPPQLPVELDRPPSLEAAAAVAFWLVSRLGAAGIVLALFRRLGAGLLLGGAVSSLLAVHAFVSDDPRRMPGEWLWLVGAAYLLVKLARFHREPLLSIDLRDVDTDPPLYRTLLDRPSAVAPILGLAALPFLAVGIIAPLRQGVLAATPAAAGESAPPSVADLFAQAKAQPVDAIAYPPTPVVWTGELSHFSARADGSLGSFAFRPGKRGLAVGDAQVPCRVAASVQLAMPGGALRGTGTVTATIAGTGALGEPVLDVTEIRFD